MRKTSYLITFLSVLLMASARLYAGAAAVGSLTFDSDTKQVSVTTSCASPTQIMTKTSYISHNVVVNISTWTNLFLSTASTLTPTSNNSLFFIPSNSSFSPDGPSDAYNGALWACSSPTVSGITANAQTVGILRTR